jgi:hypothetical protein
VTIKEKPKLPPPPRRQASFPQDRPPRSCAQNPHQPPRDNPADCPLRVIVTHPPCSLTPAMVFGNATILAPLTKKSRVAARRARTRIAECRGNKTMAGLPHGRRRGGSGPSPWRLATVSVARGRAGPEGTGLLPAISPCIRGVNSEGWRYNLTVPPRSQETLLRRRQ